MALLSMALSVFVDGVTIMEDEESGGNAGSNQSSIQSNQDEQVCLFYVKVQNEVTGNGKG